MSFLPVIIIGFILFFAYKWWNSKLQKSTIDEPRKKSQDLETGINIDNIPMVSKFDKAINKIARDLKSGKIKQGNIAELIEKETGIKLNSDFDFEADNKRFQQMEKENEEDSFFTKNYELYNAFQTILEILHNTRKLEDPFSIKCNSFKIVEKFNILKKCKDSKLYSKVFLLAVSDLSKNKPEIHINSEMMKVLKFKYLD